MSRTTVLQDFIVPVCRAERDSRLLNLKALLGTAFFINGDGIFLTAFHVVKDIPTDASRRNFGLVVKDFDGDPLPSSFIELDSVEPAPKPFDIAIGRVRLQTRSWFVAPANKDITGWQDVGAIGYPATALDSSPGKFNVNLRMLKGYVVRNVAQDDGSILGEHPDSFELSFVTTSGLSGSPLFIPIGRDNHLIGVCTTHVSSERLVEKTSAKDDQGDLVTERLLEFEQYGLAQSIVPLLDWRPLILHGQTLCEAITPRS